MQNAERVLRTAKKLLGEWNILRRGESLAELERREQRNAYMRNYWRRRRTERSKPRRKRRSGI